MKMLFGTRLFLKNTALQHVRKKTSLRMISKLPF